MFPTTQRNCQLLLPRVPCCFKLLSLLSPTGMSCVPPFCFPGLDSLHRNSPPSLNFPPYSSPHSLLSSPTKTPCFVLHWNCNTPLPLYIFIFLSSFSSLFFVFSTFHCTFHPQLDYRLLEAKAVFLFVIVTLVSNTVLNMKWMLKKGLLNE